jgi:hypothetical protein
MQGLARYMEGSFGEAAGLLKLAVQLRPDILIIHAFLAASLGQLGDGAAGRATIARFQGLTQIDIQAFAETFPDPDGRKLLLEGLELARRAEASDIVGATTPR